jgi:hypothetical protein
MVGSGDGSGEGMRMERLTYRIENGQAFLFSHKNSSEWSYKALNKLAAYEDAEEVRAKLPEIVCLCGSTRFFKTFDEQNFRLTLEGKIVLSIGCNTKSDEGLSLTEADKVRLDELHKRKIDLCDRVLVLNVGGYIGSSTRSEIEYAKAHGKPIEYLEPSVVLEGMK